MKRVLAVVCVVPVLLAVTFFQIRFGLLPFMVSFFSRQVVVNTAFTADLGAWFAAPTWIVGTLLIGLTVAAFLQSRAGAPTFGRLLEE